MPSRSRATAVGVGDARIDLAPVPFRSKRTMLVTDSRFDVGQLVYEIPNNRFVSHAGGGLWVPLGGAGTPLNSLTGDAGVVVVPVAQNINLQGGAVNSAINFTGIAAGQMNAAVLVDTTTISINAFNQLTLAGVVSGIATTVGAVTADVVTFTLGTVAGTYAFDALVAGFDAVTPSGASYSVIAGARTTGVAGTITGTPDVTANEEAAMTAAIVTVVIVGNNAIVRVTGVAGLTINWRAVVRSVFIS